MFLRQPRWAEDPQRESSASSSSSPSNKPSPVADLVQSLAYQRLDREVTLAIRTGLRDAKAEFSFMRGKGLRSLAKFLASSVKTEKIIELFLDSQTVRELQVVPVLFEHTLAPPKRDTNNSQVVSAPSSKEIVLALRVLEGCCLIDTGSRLLASRYAAVKVLIALLLRSTPSEQSVCLDALLAVLLDSSSNQKEFERFQGVRKVAELVKNTGVESDVRLKCAEFLLLLIGHIFPSNSKPANDFQHAEGRKSLVTSEDAKQNILNTLGLRCGVVLDDMISSDPTILDFESKQTSLRLLGQRLVDLS